MAYSLSPQMEGLVSDDRVTEPADSRDRVEAAYRNQSTRMWRALLAYSGDPDVASDAVAEAFAFLAAAPMRNVKEFEPTFACVADVSGAVDDWLVTGGQAYSVNQEFQDFKATAPRVDDEAHPTRQAGQWWRRLD